MSRFTLETPLSRRFFLAGAGAAVALSASPALATPSLLRGAGKYRQLAMVNPRTDEWLKSVYWADGEYIPEALEALNFILRDWRDEKVKRIDPKTLDILAQVHRLLETDEPFTIISGYRTRHTNEMLRRRSRGVAKNSYHIKGMAVDVRLRSRSVNQVARAGLTLAQGGVGRYSRHNFVHLDSGPVRHWGR